MQARNCLDLLPAFLCLHAILSSVQLPLIFVVNWISASYLLVCVYSFKQLDETWLLNRKSECLKKVASETTLIYLTPAVVKVHIYAREVINRVKQMAGSMLPCLLFILYDVCCNKKVILKRSLFL